MANVTNKQLVKLLRDLAKNLTNDKSYPGAVMTVGLHLTSMLDKHVPEAEANERRSA
jgi:hypothetical protein